MALTRAHSGLQTDTATLIERLKRGERAAQSEFFDRYVAMVERVLFRLLGPDPELQDIAQEAFIQALASIKAYWGTDGALESWLRSVTVRTALKRVRWRKTRRWLGFSSHDAHLDLPTNIDPATQATLARALEVLGRLPLAEKTVFVLRFVEGMQLKEVAEACGISVATVKRRIERSRTRFQQLAGTDPLLIEWMQTHSGVAT